LGETFESVRRLVLSGEIRISEHGYEELSADQLYAREVVEGFPGATIIEEYQDYPKGPCVLVLQRDRYNQPIHVVWGIPKGYSGPAVLITAYKPDPELWEKNFLRRKK